MFKLLTKSTLILFLVGTVLLINGVFPSKSTNSPIENVQEFWKSSQSGDFDNVDIYWVNKVHGISTDREVVKIRAKALAKEIYRKKWKILVIDEINIDSDLAKVAVNVISKDKKQTTFNIDLVEDYLGNWKIYYMEDNAKRLLPDGV